jgi:hypothetical protein
MKYIQDTITKIVNEPPIVKPPICGEISWVKNKQDSGIVINRNMWCK